MKRLDYIAPFHVPESTHAKREGVVTEDVKKKKTVPLTVMVLVLVLVFVRAVVMVTHDGCGNVCQASLLTSAAVSSLVSSRGRPLERFFCTASSSS